MSTATLVAVRLAKEGFGAADEILAQPTDLVLAQLEYAEFLSSYERTYTELRKSQK